MKYKTLIKHQTAKYHDACGKKLKSAFCVGYFFFRPFYHTRFTLPVVISRVVVSVNHRAHAAKFRKNRYNNYINNFFYVPKESLQLSNH